MGENKHIHELDAFAKKYIKEITQEKPSIDFTKNVMTKIAAESKSSIYKNTSLISKKVWFVLGVVFVAILFIPFKQNSTLYTVPKINFNFFKNYQVSTVFNNISFSDITFYAILLFGLMVFGQIIYLKKYFDKRIS